MVAENLVHCFEIGKRGSCASLEYRSIHQTVLISKLKVRLELFLQKWEEGPEKFGIKPEPIKTFDGSRRRPPKCLLSVEELSSCGTIYIDRHWVCRYTAV